LRLAQRQIGGHRVSGSAAGDDEEFSKASAEVLARPCVARPGADVARRETPVLAAIEKLDRGLAYQHERDLVTGLRGLDGGGAVRCATQPDTKHLPRRTDRAEPDDLTVAVLGTVRCEDERFLGIGAERTGEHLAGGGRAAQELRGVGLRRGCCAHQ
jgi:hypothetical protein